MRMAWAGAMILAVAAPAVANERNGLQQIVAGDFAGAAKRLEAERRIYPNRPELMLNLAAVYLRTGQTARATTLYESVLDRPATAMDLPTGEVTSSHAIAMRGLARLPRATAAR